MSRLREVPNTVSEWAQDIARKLGRRVYDPRSLDYVIRQATAAAEIDNARRSARGYEPRGHSRGRGR